MVALRTSIVLAADDPAGLAHFYGAMLQAAPEPGLSPSHWRLPWPAGGWLELYAPGGDRPQPRQPGRLALCLQQEAGREDPSEALDHWLASALGAGAALLEPIRLEPFGAEAWLEDPEGNRLLLLVVP